MNIDHILDNSDAGTNELIVTSQMRDFLKETAKWANFLAITGFVFMGLGLIILLLGGGTMIYAMMSMSGLEGGMTGIIILMYVAMYAIIFLPLLYLFRFGKNTKRALKTDNQTALLDGFENLKSFFKFYGILAAIFLSIYGIAFLAGLFFSLISSM